MTPSTIDRPELEDRVRAALATRARTTTPDVPDRFAPGPAGAVRPPALRPRRRALVAAAAVLAVAAAGLAAIAVGVRDDGDPDSVTDDLPPATAPGIPVPGPTGSRWFVLDLPGVTPESPIREATPATPGGPPALQAFRTEAGFDGPSVWVEPGDVGGTEGATEVTVQGRPGFVREMGDVVRLTTDAGFSLHAVHLAVEDVVAFADGLEPRAGGGWDATVLPQGLGEVTTAAAPQPAGERTEWSYTGTDGANLELFVNPGGPAVFEDWVREHVASGGEVEAISVDGRPGVLFDDGGSETIAVWQPTGDVVVDFRTSLDRDGLLAAMAALRPVDEATWTEQFPPDQRPD